MEKLKKEIVNKIFKKHNLYYKNFINDNNLTNKEQMEEFEEYLKDFKEAYNKNFEINIYFIQDRQYQQIIFKENGKTKFNFDMLKEEIIEIIK